MTSLAQSETPRLLRRDIRWWNRSASQFWLNEAILLLAIAQMIVSAAAEPLQGAQIAIELVLALLLGVGLSTKRLEIADFSLLSLLALVSLVAVLQGHTAFYLVNLKQNGLAALSLVYFSKIKHKSNIIFPVLVATSALILLNRIDHRVSENYAAFTADPAFNLSRFGGIFMSAHFNAFFMAAALLHYGRRFQLFGSGGMLVYYTASKFVFAAYIVGFAWNAVAGRVPDRLRAGLVGAMLVCIFVAVPIAFLKPSIALRMVDGFDQNSLTIILAQLLDPTYYQYLLNLVPADPWNVAEYARFHFSFHDGANEIGFFALAVQSGLLFGGVFLVQLIRRSPRYGAFILMSLLHNLFILAPIMIFMFTQFGRDISTEKTSGDTA